MKTLLITREGFDALKQELDQLWRVERPEVTRKAREKFGYLLK